ncbi:hypothetical protein RB594_006455 [Gaeumannomyces avenae]
MALTCAHRSPSPCPEDFPHPSPHHTKPSIPIHRQNLATMGLTQDSPLSALGFFPAPETPRSLPQFTTTMAASSTQYATPMGRGAYDTTGVPKPPPPKPR